MIGRGGGREGGMDGWESWWEDNIYKVNTIYYNNIGKDSSFD